MLDRKGKRKRWTQSRAAEAHYNTQLRGVAKQVRLIIQGLAPDGGLDRVNQILKALSDYAELITPWATSVAQYLANDVARRDQALWRRNSVDMSKELAREIKQAPTGALLRQFQGEQVKLIKSLPLKAAERVHELALRGLVDSKRADVIKRDILATSSVTEGRARLIARTETTRVSSNLVQARAQYAGSDGYIWRTSGDRDVRESHAEMEGKYVRWSEPPTLDNLKGHAGTLPNCRCFAEPVFPND